MRRAPWPKLEHLVMREHGHACRDYARALVERAQLDEKRRAKEGVRIQSQEELLLGLTIGRIRARILGPLHEWSSWITLDGTREYDVLVHAPAPGASKLENAEDAVDFGPSFSILLDSRGVPVGLYDEETLRLDHYVGWEEFNENYQRWSASGIEPSLVSTYPWTEGALVLGTLDMEDGGFIRSPGAQLPLPPQPNSGVYEPKPAVDVLPKADLAADVVREEARLTLSAGLAELVAQLVAQYPNPPKP
jgi:hypothetical protein